MIVMLANTTGVRTGYLAGRFPGKVGHLFSPGAERGPYEFMPYALDNGAFSQGANWSEEGWLALLAWARLSGQRPLWALVPDTVGDRDDTLRKWDKYYPALKPYGWPLGFAVQDGMTPGDVPSEASIVFVGGNTDWKWNTLTTWCDAFPRVHVGRVNSYHRLWLCHDAGAESIDGTGWLRGDQIQYRGLMAYMEESTNQKRRTVQLGLEDVA